MISVFRPVSASLLLFFFNDTATTEIYTLSLHDALPICRRTIAAWSALLKCANRLTERACRRKIGGNSPVRHGRSEEHTSELQSLAYLVCRLLLEKKKYNKTDILHTTHISSTSDPKHRRN